jgi:tRNA(Ile)-lysidine synthetase-like protein
MEIINFPLYSTIAKFIKKYNTTNILISLSGGVDSMVLLEIIKTVKLVDIPDLSIHCCHLNYNNREESPDERDFLKEYCQLKDIELDYIDIDFKRGDMKRNLYEKETRQIRYDYYKEISNKYNCDGVFLAHHKDDVCENIFNNLMRGSRELTDLTVIKERNNILGIEIYRPMLDHFKDNVLDIANNCNIPYFLDSTPDWSCRGKMRRNIFPTCEDCYTHNYKSSLLKLGKESDEVEHIIHKYLIEDILNRIEKIDDTILLPNESILQEEYILKIVLRKVCHKYSMKIMKTTCVERLAQHLREKRLGKMKITLLKNYSITINVDRISFDIICLI